MMPDVWFISDTHFGHKNILTFQHEEKPLRPFDSLTEMHVHIIEQWNSVVQSQDKIYHLGDVAMTLDGLNILHMLNGKKRLIRGNHDGFKLRKYTEHFEEVYGVRQIDGYWLTHVPMHTYSMDRAKANIHGHLHAKLVRLPVTSAADEQGGNPDPRYVNVCVEQINYTPINFDEIRQRFE